ncbi:MAG: thioredoxin family protein [Mariprofundales bacterium]
MALVASIHVEQDSQLPDFTLNDAYGTKHKSNQLAGKHGLLLIVTCNHCPYAIAVWPRIIRYAAEFRAQGINTAAINPNINPDYPQDSPAAMQDKIKEWGIDFPYLVDAEQTVAKDLDAQCTPDIYLYNASGNLYYHGRIDDYWKDENKATTYELSAASKAMLADKPAPQPQYPTIGCSIKWNN